MASLALSNRKGNVKASRKSWASLIQKTYEVDPLVCPKCHDIMRILHINKPTPTQILNTHGMITYSHNAL